jgi:hypothetical protein
MSISSHFCSLLLVLVAPSVVRLLFMVVRLLCYFVAVAVRVICLGVYYKLISNIIFFLFIKINGKVKKQTNDGKSFGRVEVVDVVR